MGSWLTSLVPWGLEVIKTIQTIQTGWLTSFFKVITFIGDKEGYLLLFPIMFWCIHADWGRRMGVVGLTSLSINTCLKLWFAIPRPSASAVKVLVDIHSPAFPSGHAQGTASTWGYVAWVWKSWKGRAVLVSLLLLVGLSRLYLGVHYPQDVLAGWLIAATLLGLFFWLEPKITPKFQSLPLPVQCVLAGGLPLLLLLGASTSETNITIVAALSGYNVGLVFDAQWLGYKSEGNWQKRLLRILGLVVVGALWVGLKKILPGGFVGRFVRYCLVGTSISFVAPWIFVKLGWAEAKNSQEEAAA